MLKNLFSPIGLTWLIYVVLIICSACVTAYFGKQMGSDFILIPSMDVLLLTTPNLSMGLVTAVGFFFISLLSGVFAYHAGAWHAAGRPGWKMIGQFALLLLACDILTNYISWSTIRTQKAVVSENSNTIAKRNQERLTELRETRAQLSAVIQAPGAWIAVKDAEQALKATLEAQKREGNRVRCGPKCEALAAKARDLRLEIAKSRTREKAIADREKIDAELVKLQAVAKTEKKVADPTRAQNEELASLFKGMNPDESAKFVAAKVIGLAGAIMFTLSASACGLLLGQLQGSARGTRNDYSDYAQQGLIAASNEFKPNPIDPRQGYPLHAQDVPQSTSNVTVNYRGRSSPSVDRLMSMIKEFEDNANSSARV